MRRLTRDGRAVKVGSASESLIVVLKALVVRTKVMVEVEFQRRVLLRDFNYRASCRALPELRGVALALLNPLEVRASQFRGVRILGT